MSEQYVVNEVLFSIVLEKLDRESSWVFRWISIEIQGVILLAERVVNNF